jgi:membrane-bound lytic murein transglycosylase D
VLKKTMMKRKLFFALVLCFTWLSVVYADGGPNKKASTAKKHASVKPKKTIVLKDNVKLPGRVADSMDNKEGFNNLFENAASNGARLNPRAISFVQDYMANNSDDLLKMKEWSAPYFNIIDGVLSKYGLPTQLKYLAVIESELKSTALSGVGARGPWQLMPQTARDLGLKVSHTKDERINYYKSSHAAAIYLKDLYNEFGDWLLVIAAYNGGPVPVNAAIRKSGSRNFWVLQNYLPAESRTHVKKFIATQYVFEGQGSVTTLTKAEVTQQMGVTATYLLARKLTPAEQKTVKSINLSGKYYAAAIVKDINMNMNEFNRFNPDFDKMMASTNNAYELKLPADKMEQFMANKYAILNDSVQMLLSGETVSTVK